MSVMNGFKKIKRDVGIKRCLVVEGNVSDVYLYKNKIINLRNYLETILGDMQYDGVVYWDRVEGASGAVDQLKIVEDAEVSGDSYFEGAEVVEESVVGSGMLKKPSEIFNVILRNLTHPTKKFAFIINWGEYLFNNTNSITDEEREYLTLLAKAIKDKKPEYLESSKNDSSIILISNKISMLPLSFYNNNPDVSDIVIQKPDRKEREEFLKKIESGFNVKLNVGESLSDNVKFPEYVDMLDDFTNREIIQLSKLSNKESKMTFEKLFYLYKYGEIDNPWEKLDYSQVKKVKEILNSKVIGQEQAIEKVENTIVKAFMGLTGIHKSSSRTSPKGIFFFVGPTGVGKTELSKSLAKFLFGDEQACIRFDMSEYSQDNSDQKLIGAPPGYVGFEEGGQLTNAVKEKPFSVILFDEIEKAAKPNPRILDIFLQILEDGRLTDSKGETVSFSDTIIIFTSNLGASEVNPSGDFETVAKEFTDVVKDYFDNELKRPEILGRIGYNNIVPFNFIHDKEFIKKITLSKLNTLCKAITEKYSLDIEFESNDKMVDYIASFVDIKKGARDILNSVNDNFLDQLSRFLFENKEDLNSFKNTSIIVTIKNKGLEFDFVI